MNAVTLSAHILTALKKKRVQWCSGRGVDIERSLTDFPKAPHTLASLEMHKAFV